MSDRNYPTQGARVSAETGKSMRDHVLDDANLGEHRNAVALYANYLSNTGYGRPSDAARAAVRQYRLNPHSILAREGGRGLDGENPCNCSACREKGSSA